MKRILVVEDYHALVDIETLLCQMEGYDVKSAQTGEEGLSLIGSYKPDLVILDLVMPGVDGFEVISSLKGDPRTASIPILVCTAHDLTPADKERLNGKILGIVTKGTDARDGLRQWLATAAAPALGSVAGDA